MKALVTFATMLLWVAGVVIAKGAWSTTFAVFIPFYAAYLVVEKLLIVWGVV